MSSNDYLGISTNRELASEFYSECGKDYFFSSASARLLSGTEKVYQDLEILLAQLFNKEKALIFNTGYQCNLGVVSALNKKGNVVFADRLCHASIIDGMKISDGDFYRFKHCDYEHLELLLKAHRDKYKNAIIVTESVFSMDGDTADIKKLVEIKQKYGCLLMVDEAHAFCAIDEGFANGISAELDVDIVTATFGKALGSFGAFVATSADIIELLINTARSFIFSTAIPPINIAWSYWLLTKKAEYLLSQKKKLFNNIIDVHRYLKKLGLETTSETQIIPFIFKDDDLALKVCGDLQSNGYFVLPICPPTVPQGRK